MQMLYQIFYRLHGVRRVQEMLNPRTSILRAFPRNSILQHLTYGHESADIDVSKLYFSEYIRRIWVGYPDIITDKPKGVPYKKAVVLRTLFRSFHIKNKKFKYVPELFKIQNDEQSLYVENYNYLDQLYRYAELPMSSYNKWWDFQRTMWDNVQRTSQISSKNHFFIIDVPQELVSFNLLRLYSERFNTGALKIFDKPEKLFILELFKWISGQSREETIFGALTQNNLAKINLVFTIEDGRSSVLNMGYLSSWIEKGENLTEYASVTQYPSQQVQKLLLKYLMTLASSVTENQEIEEPPSQNTDDLDQESDIEDEESENEDTQTLGYLKKPLLDRGIKTKKDIGNPLSEPEVQEQEVDLSDQLEMIDDDLKVLEILQTKKLASRGVQVDKSGTVQLDSVQKKDIDLQTIRSMVYDEEDAQSSLKRQVEQYADQGLLSASDYKKLIKDVQAYEEMPDPYGSGETVVQASKITPEMILLDPVRTKIEASEMVLDRSMLSSTLQSYDHDYINNVLSKDVLSMVGSLQRAGVIIRKHEIEVDNSALGTYENHTLELKPLDGQTSTIRFRIPKIDEDGTFHVSASKYVLRKQRVDQPIRKIDATTVALTSYYGKTFVALNPKKSNSSIAWLVKELNKASMQEHPYIKRVGPASVFDNNFTAPYIYNALADNFKTINTTKYKLVFDHTERVNLVNETQLKKLESDGSRVVGQTIKGKPLVVDKEDRFFWVDDNAQLILIGDIYDVLELDSTSSPIDFTEVRIFSKTVPVALILGYSIGFKNLIRLLGAKYRVVIGRQNKNLQTDEYAISFKDTSYIFSKKQRVASMILSGFLEHEKQLKQYLSEDLDDKDVYFNLLQSKGLSSIYIREIEATQQLFIDPITKGILEQMGEPVTFNGLLVRSTELLQTYHHPDTQDMQAMRVRGYERLSGVIYKELTTAIRQYRNRNISGKSKIDISPYQVWSTIMKDPAIKLVEDINPIQNLKESEIVTYVGEGGRSKDSLSKPSRAYHQNDMGIVSEATVDSSDVGINAYLSANPNFKDMRGMPLKSDNITPTQLISTSALMAPGSDRDD